MSLTTFLLTLKGGAGSGHHGHSGIPGHRGGSAISFGSDIHIVNNTGELTPSVMGYAYFVLPDGRIVDVNKSGGNHEETAKRMSQYSEKYIPKDMNQEDPYIHTLLQEGIIKVRNFGDRTAIETAEVNTTELKKLQKLVDQDRLEFHPQGETVWYSKLSKTSIYGNYQDFMSSKFVTNSKLKELRR